MVWGYKCHQNNSPVECDGCVKYEEAKIGRLLAIWKTKLIAAAVAAAAADRVEYSRQPASARCAQIHFKLLLIKTVESAYLSQTFSRLLLTKNNFFEITDYYRLNVRQLNSLWQPCLLGILCMTRWLRMIQSKNKAGSVLGLTPPGLEFRILCLEDSVIAFISPSSGGSPGPV